MKNEAMVNTICRELERDFPIEPRPYQAMARRIGCKEQEFIKVVKRCKGEGLLKKIAASLDYRRLGFRANAMVVWVVPRQKLKESARIMSGFAEVTHCYQRRTARHWPYNLFTMIHAKTNRGCEQIARRIAQATRVRRYQLIYSTKELKKRRMRYFATN